jgi:tetratricopeptide (TPR) repeat protein
MDEFMTKFVRVVFAATAFALFAAPALAHPDPSLLARSRTAEMKGQIAEALLLIQSAIVAHPGDPQNYIALADLYSRTGHPNAAVKYYDDALFINPIDKTALKGMALAKVALGDQANAAKNLDLLEQTCGPRCPETLAVREALDKARKTEADASAAPLDKH